MSKPPQNEHQVSPVKFIIALVAVVGLVALVSPLLSKKEDYQLLDYS